MIRKCERSTDHVFIPLDRAIEFKYDSGAAKEDTSKVETVMCQKCLTILTRDQESGLFNTKDL